MRMARTRKKRKPFLLAAALGFGLAGATGACIWDSRTLSDEVAYDVDLMEALIGYIPTHGPAFHENRLLFSRAPIVGTFLAGEFGLDRAVSLMELGRLDEAEEELQEALRDHPGEYRILSNLGVLAERRGDLGEAVRLTRRALEVNPAGHPGVGDLYLRMLEWRAARAAGGDPARDFTGRRYDAGAEAGFLVPAPGSVPVGEGSLLALIKAAPRFPDAYLVLGDLLRSQGREGEALWAYLRAEDLGHPAEAAVGARADELLARFRAWWWMARFDSELSFDPAAARREAREWFARGDRWREEFHRTEARLAEGDHPQPTFQEVRGEVEGRGAYRLPGALVPKDRIGSRLRTLASALMTTLAVVLLIRLRRPA